MCPSWFSSSIRAVTTVGSVLLLSLALAACSTSEDPAGTDAPGVEGAADGVIRCTYAYRESHELMEGQTGDEPAFQFEERVLQVGADERADELLGQLTLSVGYDIAEYDTSSFSLAAAAADTNVFSILYQVGDRLPQNQFVGGHGFTGLLYFRHPTAGGDYQAYCEAVP
jgi:hypothetical protein